MVSTACICFKVTYLAVSLAHFIFIMAVFGNPLPRAVAAVPATTGGPGVGRGSGGLQGILEEVLSQRDDGQAAGSQEKKSKIHLLASGLNAWADQRGHAVPGRSGKQFQLCWGSSAASGSAAVRPQRRRGHWSRGPQPVTVPASAPRASENCEVHAAASL